MTNFTTRIARKPSVALAIVPMTSPAATRVLFDPSYTGRLTRPSRRFGAGIHAYVPHERLSGHSGADEVFYATLMGGMDAEEREIEREAREVAQRKFNIIMDERAEAAGLLERACEGAVL